MLLATLAGAYTAYWFHAAGQVHKAVLAWADEKRAAGWQVRWTDLSMHGFPSRVAMRLREPALAAPGGAAWRAEALTAVSSPFDGDRVRIDAAGRHEIAAGFWHAEITAATLTVDLTLASGRLREAAIAASGLASPGGGTADSLTVSAIPTEAGLSFSATATGFRLDEPSWTVLDPLIARAEVAGRIAGPLAPGPLTEAVERWSAAGGTVEVERLMLDWPPITLEADGTMALDPQMQPLAAFSAKVRGYGQLMDNLARAGIVEPGAAEAAKMLLALMAKPDSHGRPAVPVPLTVQSGRLWLGPAPVAQFPPLIWPTPH